MSWSRHYEQCIQCGTIDRRHDGKGLCWLCAHHARRPLQDWSDKSRNRRYTVNDNLLDDMTPDAAYFYGVMVAEGHLARPWGMTIAISLRDLTWMQDIARMIGFEGPIETYANSTSGVCRFSIASKRLYREIVSLGAKTPNPRIPSSNIKHFVRGVFDGDGSLYVSSQCGHMHSSFAGSKALLENIKSILAAECDMSNRLKVHPKTNRPTCHSLRYGRDDTVRLGDWLYSESGVCLQRMKEFFFTHRKVGQ
jgi:hypothetical protein